MLKRGSAGIEHIKKEGALTQTVAELWFLLTRWQWLLPFVINQCGSLVYYITLGSADISMAVPIANSTTFFWTWAAGVYLGDEKVNARTLIGSAFVVLGVALCVYSKVDLEQHRDTR
mmetsp:Transcript_46904/g.73415  ORF Transcript_46904/g.73415 Transcript_46904/m.73415 type:complete len:117 (+) Transcript_46904:669-1019(+)